MIHIALVEDDDKFVKTVEGFINRFNNEMKAQCNLTRFKNGLDFISSYQPVYDMVLLDIEMPLMDGMETAFRLRAIEEDIPILFVTNMAQMAIKGYEVNALDFMVKPVGYLTFVQKLQKAIDHVRTHSAHAVVLKMKDGCKKVSTRDIKYVEVFGHFLIYHLVKEDIQVRGTLSKVEEELAPFNFIRSSDCYLVNLRYVTGFTSNTIQIDNNEFPISRRKKKEFKERLTNFLGGGE